MTAETAAEERPPLQVWTIALLALAPFIGAALAYSFGPAWEARPAITVMLGWSSVVLAFLGGVRWGLETGQAHPRWSRLALSVISPVGAFALLMARDSLDLPWVLVGFLAAFILQWLFDHTAPDVPARYPRLMTILTLGACVSLAMALEQALRM